MSELRFIGDDEAKVEVQSARNPFASKPLILSVLRRLRLRSEHRREQLHGPLQKWAQQTRVRESACCAQGGEGSTAGFQS